MPLPVRSEPSQAAPIDRVDSGLVAGPSTTLYVYYCFASIHILFMLFFSSVQPPVQSRGKSSRAKREKITFTEADISEDRKKTASAGKQKKWLKRMNRHQSGFINDPSIPPGSAAAKFADNFIPSRHGNKRRKSSGKTINLQLRVNVRGGDIPQVNVNVDDPSQIQVTVVRGANHSVATANLSNASGSRSVDARIAPDEAGENAEDEPRPAS